MDHQTATLTTLRKGAQPSWHVCTHCKGKGQRFSQKAGHRVIKCPDCNGTGYPPREA